MKVVALVSGGKDSCYNMLLCQQHGHEIVALANLLPAELGVVELDSYMFQTVGHQAIELYAECMGVPLLRRRIRGTSGMAYTATEDDEVEDMLQLLAWARQCHPGIEAVSSGAIASDYQRLRVEHVCTRLGLVSLAYMWHQPQARLLDAMLAARIEAVLVKVAAMGLVPQRHLGASLAAMRAHLHRMRREYGCNVCGEGGEYETLVLDCPGLFRHGRIVLDAWEPIALSAGGLGAVAILHPTRFHLERCRAASAGSAPGSGGRDSSAAERGAGAHAAAPGEANAAADREPAGRSGIARAFGSKAEVAFMPEGCIMDVSAVAGEDCLGLGCTAEAALQVSSCGVQVSCAPRSAEGQPGLGVGAALHAALSAIERALERVGLGLGDALFVHLYLADMAYFGAANAAYARRFPAVSPPARACVQAPLLPGCDVAVDILLAHDVAARRVLHVQSISSWAPSCIGPYSQATSLAPPGVAFFAGQIGLDPASMQLVPPRDQAARCLASCQAVAVAVRTDLLRALLGCTVYAAGSRDARAPPHEAAHSSGRVAGENAGSWDGDRRAAAAGESSGRAALEQAAQLLQDMLEGHGTTEPLPEGPAEPGDGEDGEGSLPEDAGWEEDAAEDEEYLDEYLRPPAMPERHWAPLLTYVIVPGLPKGAAVELQPLACSAAGLEAGARPGWADGLTNTTQSFPIGSAPEGCSIACNVLSSPGRACLLQLSLPRAAMRDRPDRLLAAAGAVLGDAVDAALAAAQLRMQDLLCVRACFCPELLTGQQAAALLSDALIGGCCPPAEGAEQRQAWLPAPVYVPVHAVGGSPAADAALHIVAFALNSQHL